VDQSRPHSVKTDPSFNMVFKAVELVQVKAISMDSPTTSDTDDTVPLDDESHSYNGGGQDEDQSEEEGHVQQPVSDAKDDADDSDSDQDVQERSAKTVRWKKQDSDDRDGSLDDDVTGPHNEEAHVSRFKRYICPCSVWCVDFL
jgi:hypothetical protein